MTMPYYAIIVVKDPLSPTGKLWNVEWYDDQNKMISSDHWFGSEKVAEFFAEKKLNKILKKYEMYEQGNPKGT
jgi:hypothetical protein